MDTTSLTIRPPMFISGRLMAALRVAETGAVIHIAPTSRDADGRIVWRYVIEDSDRQVLDDATDLRSGTGDDPDPTAAMVTLLGFLGAAAETYRHALNGQHSENADLFPPHVCEWAYEHDDELAALALDLEPHDEPHRQGDDDWGETWDETGCADCAAAAAQGRPTGPAHCWATHRPHTPPAADNDTGGHQR